MPQSILASLTGLGTDRAVMETAIADGYGEQDMSSLVEPLRKKK